MQRLNFEAFILYIENCGHTCTQVLEIKTYENVILTRLNPLLIKPSVVQCPEIL